MNVLSGRKQPLTSYLRVVKGVLFFVLGLIFALLAYEVFSKLWGYQDSPLWLYIAYGSVAALVSVVCLAVAAESLRRD